MRRFHADCEIRNLRNPSLILDYAQLVTSRLDNARQIDYWCDDASIWDAQSVHQVSVTGWTLQQRGYFESSTSLINIPSYALAGWLINRVGSLRSLQLGTVANAVFYAALGRASSGWHLYAAYIWLTITQFGNSTYSAQSAMAMAEAHRAGFGCVAGFAAPSLGPKI